MKIYNLDVKFPFLLKSSLAIVTLIFNQQFCFSQSCADAIYCFDSGGDQYLALLFYNEQEANELYNEMLSNPVVINFGASHPLNGEYYSGPNIISLGNLYFLPLVFNGNLMSCAGYGTFPLADVTLPGGQTCVYEFNLLCPECEPAPDPDCEDFVTYCEDYFVNLIEQDPNIILDGCEQWAGDCGTGSSISRNGAVAIGVNAAPPDGNYRLYVRDGILTEQFKLASFINGEWGAIDSNTMTSAWCDYVFDENYPLMPLQEVEEFIQKNKHLPKTPSAKEIEEQGGFHLREAVFNHQEKIEELFLYMIELNEEVEGMQNKLKK